MVVALVRHVGLGVGARDTWGGAEVLEGLSVLGSSKEEGVSTYYNILIRIEASESPHFRSKLTCGGEEHELVQSEALATGLNDSGSSGLGEAESSDGNLGNFKESYVIGHCANHNSDSVSTNAL